MPWYGEYIIIAMLLAQVWFNVLVWRKLLKKPPQHDEPRYDLTFWRWERAATAADDD